MVFDSWGKCQQSRLEKFLTTMYICDMCVCLCVCMLIHRIIYMIGLWFFLTLFPLSPLFDLLPIPWGVSALFLSPITSLVSLLFPFKNHNLCYSVVMFWTDALELCRRHGHPHIDLTRIWPTPKSFQLLSTHIWSWNEWDDDLFS